MADISRSRFTGGSGTPGGGSGTPGGGSGAGTPGQVRGIPTPDRKIQTPGMCVCLCMYLSVDRELIVHYKCKLYEKTNLLT